jgi:hypothetical protein
MLFLDCYGRIFDWNHINCLLWPLGNYFENRLDEPKNVAWGVGNETITEFEVGTCATALFLLSFLFITIFLFLLDSQDKHRIVTQ